MVLKPYTRRNKKTTKNSAVIYISCACLLSRATGNSDSQNAILETTQFTSLLVKVYNGNNGYVLKL